MAWGRKKNLQNTLSFIHGQVIMNLIQSNLKKIDQRKVDSCLKECPKVCKEGQEHG